MTTPNFTTRHELRKACALMEHANACANRETAMGGWLSDHKTELCLAQEAFDNAYFALRTIPGWQN